VLDDERLKQGKRFGKDYFFKQAKKRGSMKQLIKLGAYRQRMFQNPHFF
jgi:hypothetical protein